MTARKKNSVDFCIVISCVLLSRDAQTNLADCLNRYKNALLNDILFVKRYFLFYNLPALNLREGVGHSDCRLMEIISGTSCNYLLKIGIMCFQMLSSLWDPQASVSLLSYSWRKYSL